LLDNDIDPTFAPYQATLPMNILKSVKIYYPALLVFIILSFSTVYIYLELTSAEKERREKLFEQRSSRATEIIKKRIGDYIQILKGCQGLFHASDSVTEANWKAYIGNLNLSKSFPGIQAVAYAAFIKKEQIPLLVEQVQKGGHQNFKIRSSFKHSVLTPIIFIEPFSGRNLRAFGFDMYDEPNRREAMERAIATGGPAMTRKVTLIQETDQDVQPGFLLYVPVFTNGSSTRTPADRMKNIRGFVYNPFRAHDLMQTIVDGFPNLNVEIFDGDTVTEANLLFRPRGDLNNNSFTQEENLVADNKLEIAGRQWLVRTSSRENFGSVIERRQPALVLLCGLAITLLMVTLSVYFINNKKNIATELQWSRELEKKKDEFIGIASHELKTPLTSTKAYIQLLERCDLKPNEQHLVKKASLQLKRVSNLIADLLDVSKIQAGSLHLNFQHFPARDLVKDSIETVQHIYSNHKIHLERDIPEVMMEGDKFRLEQALTNLMINAIKYSPNSHDVHVSVSLKSDRISIAIRDEGIGISKESQKHIFEKFYRSKDLATSFSGLGMGLYIVGEIIKRHGGTVEVLSEIKKGSTFTVHLPLKQSIS
jgi:two-component system, OmpR family, sensor kinase